MINNNVTNYTSNYNSPMGNKSYINKYDKSLKLPFYGALINNLSSTRSAQTDEIKIADSDVAASDNISISSAITGASAVSDPDTGDATYA